MAVAINGQLLTEGQEMTLGVAVRNLLIDVKDLAAKGQASATDIAYERICKELLAMLNPR